MGTSFSTIIRINHQFTAIDRAMNLRDSDLGEVDANLRDLLIDFFVAPSYNQKSGRSDKLFSQVHNSLNFMYNKLTNSQSNRPLVGHTASNARSIHLDSELRQPLCSRNSLNIQR